jgi:membrane-associated protease RseP (regulator of RpoE activity)
MSESTIITLIGLFGTVLVGIIGAWATMVAAGRSVPFLLKLLGGIACIGLGLMLFQLVTGSLTANSAHTSPLPTSVSLSPIVTLPPQAVTTEITPPSSEVAHKEPIQDTTTVGMRVIAIDPGSPAEQAGFTIGSVLLTLNGQSIRVVDDARRVVAENRGKTVEAVVLIGSQEVVLAVTLNDGPMGVDLCRLEACP